MTSRGWILGACALALLSGCNSWERYQASVEQGCREQAGNSSARYNDCLKKAAARDRERLRHQDEVWFDSLNDASRFPAVVVVPHHR